MEEKRTMFGRNGELGLNCIQDLLLKKGSSKGLVYEEWGAWEEIEEFFKET